MGYETNSSYEKNSYTNLDYHETEAEPTFFTTQDIDTACADCSDQPPVGGCSGPYQLYVFCFGVPFGYIGGWAIDMVTNVASIWNVGSSPLGPADSTTTVSPEEALELKQIIINHPRYPGACPH